MEVRRIIFIVLFIIGIFGELKSQATFDIGWIPSLNINKELPSEFDVNLKAESRQVFFEDVFSPDVKTAYYHVLTDFSLIGAKQVGLNNKIAAGYQIRLRENRTIHRTLQQLTLINRFSTFRLAHRFAADQSFETKEPVEWRLRYRLSSEFPLNGEAVDINEFYLKINNEYLNSFQADSYDLEIRIAPVLGYVISGTSKLEYGLDYRVSTFLNGSSKSNLWFNVSWYIKI